MALHHNARTRFVFTGNYMTEAGRLSDPEGLGNGYVRLIRDYLAVVKPQIAPVITNLAWDGINLTELAERMKQQVFPQRPHVLSILIDIPRPDSAGEKHSSLDQFRALYRQMLSKAADALPECKTVLCQPPAFWSDVPAELDENVRPYSDAVIEIAREFNVRIFVPLHTAFALARHSRPDIQWIDPETRPTSAGNMLIAQTWLQEGELAPH
jgi:hypothetical protein